MKDSDLQKILVVICVLIWLMAFLLPDVAFTLVVMWAGVLAFDSVDTRGRIEVIE